VEAYAKRKSTTFCLLAIPAFNRIAGLYNRHLNWGICLRLGFEFRLKTKRTEDKGLGRTELNCLGIYTGKDLVKKKASTNRKEGDGRGRV
jgi:hypothetical protein